MTPPIRIAPGWAALSAAAPAVSTVAALLLPAAVGRSVTAIATATPAGGPLTTVAVLVTVLAAANVLAALAVGSYGARVTAAVRSRAGAGAVQAGPSTMGTSDVATRLLVDARQPGALLPLTTSALLALVSAVAGLVLLARVHVLLALGVVGGLLALLVLLRRFVVSTTDLVSRYREDQAAVVARLLEAQTGATTVRAYNCWPAEIGRVLTPLPRLRGAGESLWGAQRRLGVRSAILVPAIQLVAVGLGGWLLHAGRIDVGGFTAGLGYTVIVLGGLDGLESVAALAPIRAGVRRLRELPTASPDRAVDVPAGDSSSGELVLEDLTVLHPDGTAIVEGLDARIPAGSLVALSGPAGSGRSTLAAVLAGRIRPDGGRVLLDGVDVAERRQDCVLGSPRPAMVGATVAELISAGLPVEPDAVRRAATLAAVADVVEALPDGYDTALADVAFSGGELRRLGIAQALARPSRLLVLDDATVALDAATEHTVVRALLSLRSLRTCVLVTDRRSVVRAADVVVDLDASPATRKVS